MSLIITKKFKRAKAQDAAEFHVGQRVRAKDPAYEYSDGKALGAGMFTVKEVRNNGDVRLDDDGDVWVSPSSLVEANDACGKAEDAAEACEDSSELKNALGGIFGKYKREIIDFAKSKRDEYQLEMNRTASKLTDNGNAGETLKAAQAGIRKIYEGVYALNGVHVQW